jgi:hypothetical protein
MARRCLIETCKREAETYCYHCSKDVCTKHYLEHKKGIQEELPLLTDEVNLIYDRLRRNDGSQMSVPQCFITACSQLDKWREDCHQHIDIICQRARTQIENIIDRHKRGETQKAVKNLESLEKMRQELRELLKEGDVTYRQLQTMKQQLEEIKTKEQEAIRCSDIRVITQKIDVSECISVTTDIKHPVEKQQQSRSTQKIFSTRLESIRK